MILGTSKKDQLPTYFQTLSEEAGGVMKKSSNYLRYLIQTYMQVRGG